MSRGAEIGIDENCIGEDNTGQDILLEEAKAYSSMVQCGQLMTTY